MKDKDIYEALVALSEVVYELVSLDCNYSQVIGDKLTEALIKINNCILTK